MKNTSKLLFLMMLVITTVSFVGCGPDDKPVVLPNTNYEHTGFISVDETWDANGIHILKDRVIVQAGVTLTIAPGAIIKGEMGTGANASVLVIARGAKIKAAGTAAAPIVFTSVADEIELGQKVGSNLNARTDKGFWGGVIILGNAPVSPKTGTTEQVEGIPADVIEGNYGGDDAADNSGVFTYVSIRHGGTLIGEGNEVNGLTLGGVGTGSTINHIEVVGNVDDGIECFGGTVNIDHAIVLYQGDDAFDIDQGYSGTIDNFIYIAGPTSDHGLEIDGPEGSANAGGQFVLQNGSLKGNAAQGEFADFRSGAQGRVDMLYFFGFNTAADMELDDDKTSANYLAGVLTLTSLKFNATAWTLDGDGIPDGSTTVWPALTDLFADKSDTKNTETADAKFANDGNALVTAKDGGADQSEFVGWTLADAEGLLSDF
ncbi:MAG: hypothetical protein P8N47_04130 [Bacteroidia bacterium]|jgi:hypothetical protein|nr:hypothetical protein [Bacteroidia bacterium]